MPWHGALWLIVGIRPCGGETWGWAGYGVGAAAIATGVVLYVAGWPSDKATNLALLPALAPGGASMILQGRF